jgi:hypothetical protein
MSPREAAAALGAPAARTPAGGAPNDAVPADASSPARPADRAGVVRLGSREFSVGSQELAGRKLNILPDLPDVRDRIYQPMLRPLKAEIKPKIGFAVRDQGASQRCTGFALAHVIDFLTTGRSGAWGTVSARMLYEMAKRNDEWAGSAYEGSSIRGALNGFFRNGVCSSALAPDQGVDEWVLTYAMNKEAQQRRLGAYYRLQPDVSDYHAALNELGIIYASAQIHSNWAKPVKGEIAPDGTPIGGHAFAIVGYDATGFFVLNSWGPKWGRNGVAHWSYVDWASSVMDAWVLQLGARAPAAFGAIPRAAPAGSVLPQPVSAPNRSEIIGHFINIDDGRYITAGRYASPSDAEMMETVKRLDGAGPGATGYDHLVIYCHGGLNSADDEARRIGAWQRRSIFTRNGIYNFHLMWNSDFLGEAFGELSQSEVGRTASVIGDLLFETGAGKALGSRAWRNMKQDATAAFGGDPDYDGGFFGLSKLLGPLDRTARRPKLHLVGHSAGAIVLGRLLSSLKRFGLAHLELGSIHLMAPACTVPFFDQVYAPYLDGDGGLELKDRLYLYAMSDDLELKDTVGIGGFMPYGRSLLYLVSRAYEDVPNMPLAGMQKYASGLPRSNKLHVDYAVSAATASTSHGGFDNDAATLASIMSRILGAPPPKPPKRDELTGY